jgi:RimJ/RimL family protein N-acetyltransferase
MTFALPLPPTPVLETGRLVLRPIALADAPAIQRHFPDWELLKYLHAGIPWPYPADGAVTNIRECLDQRARDERFHWAITLKDGDDEAIGRIDLWPFDGQKRDMRGFYLARSYWGRGLMTEAAERVTRYAFEDLAWPFLYLTNAEPNSGSHRIKEKQGAVLIDREPCAFMAGEFPREVWLLTRQAWMARRAPGLTPRPRGRG